MSERRRLTHSSRSSGCARCSPSCAALHARRRPAACRARGGRARSSPRRAPRARWRERAEALAVLDLQVHHRLHLRRARVAEDRARARARAGRTPSGPGSRPTTFSSAMSAATRAAHSLVRERLVGLAVRRRGTRGSAPRGNSGPEVRAAACRRVPSARRARSSSPRSRRRAAAPSAPPASPAAGWIQMSSKMPLAQQPPVGDAVERHAAREAELSLPVSSRACRATRSTISSVTSWIEAARSISRRVMRASGLRAGPPNSASKRAFVMRRPSR